MEPEELTFSAASAVVPFSMELEELTPLQRRIRAAFKQHSYNLRFDPVLAHWEAAAVSTTIGLILALARGATAAVMNPPHLRLATFAFVSRSVAPLCVPRSHIPTSSNHSHGCPTMCGRLHTLRAGQPVGLLPDNLGEPWGSAPTNVTRGGRPRVNAATRCLYMDALKGEGGVYKAGTCDDTPTEARGGAWKVGHSESSVQAYSTRGVVALQGYDISIGQSKL